MCAWTPSYLSLDLFERLSILLSAHFATDLAILAISLVCLTVRLYFIFFFVLLAYSSLSHSHTHSLSQSVSHLFSALFFFFLWPCLYLSIFRFSFIFISQKLPSKWHAFARKNCQQHALSSSSISISIFTGSTAFTFWLI